MTRLQEWIHLLEVGEGARLVRIGVVLLGLVALAAAYDWMRFRNLATPEAMDAAQVARNLAGGQGFTTKFIRPLSIHLLEAHRHRLQKGTNELTVLQTAHPDLANPPLYPLLLAGAMNVLSFDYEIAAGRPFLRYQPDLLITFVNQSLFLLALLMVFALARSLFDPTVAWISTAVVAGSELLWRFTVSGLSTMLLLVLFLALVACLTAAERGAREEQRGAGWLLGLAALSGMIVGLGMMTRYAFGWLILPTLGFLALCFPSRRWVLPLAGLLVFAATVTPWLVRNHRLSGTLFGTATYAVAQATETFPADELERSLTPALERLTPGICRQKLRANVPDILQNELPTLGGGWISAFFLVGLLVPFVNPGRRRLRGFLLASLGVLVLAQALGRSELSTASPHLNGENLLVLLAPVVAILGAALFSMLLEQLDLPFPPLKYGVAVLFVLLLGVPLLLGLLPPRGDPRVHPPYFPPLIQQFARWMQEDELMMSDMPWAVAWYGNRQCVWTPLRVRDPGGRNDFFALSDSRKPVRALYLTQLTLDAPFFSRMYVAPGEPGGRDLSWGRFVTESLLKGNLPAGFPLKSAPAEYLRNGHLLLTDRARWRKPAEPPSE